MPEAIARIERWRIVKLVARRGFFRILTPDCGSCINTAAVVAAQTTYLSRGSYTRAIVDNQPPPRRISTFQADLAARTRAWDKPARYPPRGGVGGGECTHLHQDLREDDGAERDRRRRLHGWSLADQTWWNYWSPWLLRIVHSYNIHKILTWVRYITPSGGPAHPQSPSEVRLRRFGKNNALLEARRRGY